MDLALDYKQSKALSCSHCDLTKMHLRNCQGKREKSNSPILVNGTVYFQCPRSMVADAWELGYIVSLYFDCKENKTYPFGNSLMQTTAFCSELFTILDRIVNDYKIREQKKQEDEMKKQNNKNASKK